MRYRVDGRTITVEPDRPYLKTYKVDYVNMTRDSTSTISVTGQVELRAPSTAGESGTSVKTSSKSDFWEVLRQNVDSILSASRKLEPVGGGAAGTRGARQGSARAAARPG